MQIAGKCNLQGDATDKAQRLTIVLRFNIYLNFSAFVASRVRSN